MHKYAEKEIWNPQHEGKTRPTSRPTTSHSVERYLDGCVKKGENDY